jgi:hypothetical protein
MHEFAESEEHGSSELIWSLFFVVLTSCPVGKGHLSGLSEIRGKRPEITGV